jgi:L-lactate dehydrogenase complex protein LldF
MTIHAEKAKQFLSDRERARWHDETLWLVRTKRDGAAFQVPEWEQLRDAASQIKRHVLDHLDEYLIQFEQNARANGVEVLWAADAAEHNNHVAAILKKHGVSRLVKSKSILTEECRLNEYLEHQGIEVIDTDLGERIIQWLGQPPSHIVLPAIHLKKREIGNLFHDKLGTKEGADDPQYLTEAARQHLREKFLAAEAALTGVNFGIAETGGFVVCTNEGNADMGVHLAPVHIASMGIEKLIPHVQDLAVFTRLLARSATGQNITTYTSHFQKPRSGAHLYIILVDNGRTKQLKSPVFRESLKCIRCGACMNTCPIYRRSGGFSYGSTVPGPIGSILSPNIDLTAYSSLPFASTLCGSCSDVCPVRINIHEQLYEWRQVITKNVKQPVLKRMSMRMAGFIFSNAWMYRIAGWKIRMFLRGLPGSWSRKLAMAWGRARELPEVPRESFHRWYQMNRK